MSSRDLRVEVSETSGDEGQTEVTQDGTVTTEEGVGALKRDYVFVD